MAIKHSITLSTTEPNNEVGVIKIRQADEQTQMLDVQITAYGVPMSFVGYQPFFCAKLGQTAGLGIIEQKVTGPMNPANGTLEYVMRPEDWQKVGRQIGYFAFRKMKNDHEWTEQFTTRDFTYNVIPSVIGEIREVKKDGSTYVWTIEDMLRLFDEYIASGKTDWEEFVEQNREILESVDPGGKLIGELIDARKPFGGESFTSLGNRLDNQIGKNSEFREFESDKSFMRRVFNESSERGINVKWFGAVGDGNNDDYQSITNSLNYANENNLTVYFPPGTYSISKKIEYNGRFNIFGSGTLSVIKAANAMDALFEIDKSNDNLNPDLNLITGKIYNISFNGAHLADYTLYGKQGKAVTLQSINATGAKIANIRLGSLTNEEAERCWEWDVRDIHLNGGRDDERPTFGLDIGTKFVDSTLGQIVVTNAKDTLIRNAGGSLTINDVHPYVYPVDQISECLVSSSGGANRWNNLYLDTPEKTALLVDNLGQTFSNIYILCPEFYNANLARNLIQVNYSTSLTNIVFNAPSKVETELEKLTIVNVDNSKGKVEDLHISNMFRLNKKPNKAIDLTGKMPYRITVNGEMDCNQKFQINRFKKLVTVYNGSVGENVTLANEFQNAYYQIIPEFSWQTDWWIENKTVNGFKLKVSVAPLGNTIVPITIIPYA